MDFNPLSPHGERRDEVARKMTENLISIHSPRMGRDASCCSRRRTSCYFNPLSPHGERRARLCCRRGHAVPFQSTLPAWGETVSLLPFCSLFAISIHSPRMGRDVYHMPDDGQLFNFNPLSPHGERLMKLLRKLTICIFQSTLPAWGET